MTEVQLEPLLTAQEVQALLGLRREGVYRLVASGDLPCVRVGRRVRFEPAEIRRFIEVRRERGSP